MYKYILVILLSIGQISEQCVIPQSWIDRGYTFVDMNTGGQIVLVELTAASLNIKAWNIMMTRVITISTTCHATSDVAPNLQVAWTGTSPVKNYCDTITPGDNDKALMYQENNGRQPISISDCQAPYDLFRLGIPVDSSISIPGSTTSDIFDSFVDLASGTTTSLSQNGTCQVEVTNASRTYCQGDETSTIEISGNKLILTSCQNEYNLELTWIESFTPDDSEDSGFIALLMDLTTSPSYKLYCARFKEEGCSVTMSVEIGDTDEAVCPGSMTYHTADTDIFYFNFTCPTCTTTTTNFPWQTVTSGAVISPAFPLSIICGLFWLALN